MRVVGGIAKGRKLGSPAIRDARPTLELVRSAIYNSLGSSFVEGIRIVDLFAGTGSLGIEGLSRGAIWADFVEHSPRQCAVIQSNLESTGLSYKGQVHSMDVHQALGVLRGPFTVALMDPPYKLKTLDPVLNDLASSGLVAVDGVVVVGHSKYLELKKDYSGLSKTRSRRYGDSVVDFFTLRKSW